VLACYLSVAAFFLLYSGAALFRSILFSSLQLARRGAVPSYIYTAYLSIYPLGLGLFFFILSGLQERRNSLCALPRWEVVSNLLQNRIREREYGATLRFWSVLYCT